MEKKYQIVLLIILFTFLVFISFLFSPFFHIRDFIFHSKNEINKNELKITINDYYGNNLLFMNKEELKNDLLNNNLISAVQIEKSFPSTIHIIIEERNSVAWLQNNNRKLIFSADGIILAEKKLESELNLPKVEGFAYYFNNQKIKLPDFTGDLLEVFSSINTDFLAQIIKVVYQNNVYKLYLKNGAGVNLGENKNLEQKFAILNSILKSHQNTKIDYINLQVVKHPVIKLK